jgi:hypothetical protein
MSSSQLPCKGQFKTENMKNLLLFFVVYCAFIFASRPVSAAITGFGDGSDYTLTGITQDDSGNITDNDPPTISSGALTLTTGEGGESRAAFFNTAQAVNTFTAQFTFQYTSDAASSLGSADGFAFVLQEDPRGTSAIGGGGAGLGYGLVNANQPPPPAPQLTPIVNSAAVEFLLRDGGNGATDFETGGAISSSPASTGLVDLVGGDPILVNLVYDGVTLTETLTDETNPLDTYTTSYLADIPSAVGGDDAFVGFTGGTGGAFGTQTISNFSFDAIPEPSTNAMIGLGILLLLAFGRLRQLWT